MRRAGDGGIQSWRRTDLLDGLAHLMARGNVKHVWII